MFGKGKMPIKPENWNVVIVGAWNRAILTPSGIARRLYKLPEHHPVEVFVPLDVIAPYQVKHDDVIVTAGSGRLIVEPTICTYDKLYSAMEIGFRALNDLPETPVTAAGFNIRYKTKDSIPAFLDLLEHSWDDKFSDEDYNIEARSIGRTVKWKDGRIQIVLSKDSDSECELLLNFDKSSSANNDLKSWLSIPIDEIQKEAAKLLHNCIGLKKEDIENDEDE